MPATLAPLASAEATTTLPSAPEAPVTTTILPSMRSLQSEADNRRKRHYRQVNPTEIQPHHSPKNTCPRLKFQHLLAIVKICGSSVSETQNRCAMGGVRSVEGVKAS